MSSEPVATSDGPPRRRPSWNLAAIVQDVGGRPIGDFQEPGRALHPYSQAHLTPSAAPRAAVAAPEESFDPVSRVYPPLVGPTGRSLHGTESEHHAPTLASVASEPVARVGVAAHAPGPAHRPERIYLHYLLLHLDRLNDSALAYLYQSVVEERQHRSGALSRPRATLAAETAEPPEAAPPAA
ncbi:MAG: hypothetical protein L3K05_07675 [Thermoplasmata archaeon]|nr:hypothetical protein [Thermoplasmata archaeon]